MPSTMRRFSGTLEHPPPRQNATDRRHSNASDISLSDTNHSRQLSQENIEYIPTRLTKVTAPKPAANPLQFVKVGPACLYKSAQEQLKKVEEIKKVKKEVREEAEDWQSNLDNWKSSRRKRQEHIIERVVEVKKLELEEHDRNRRRSKTFSEMMEERNTRGRKASLTTLALYNDDDSNDLSDLGIGTSSGKSSISEEYNDNHFSSMDKEEAENHENHNGKHGKNGHHDDDGSSLATASSPEPEEYTYERAIQGYVNFTETRVKSSTAHTKNNVNNSKEEGERTRTEKLTNGHSKGLPPSPPQTPRRPSTDAPRRQSTAKIEEKLSALEKRRRSSTELNNTTNKDLKMPPLAKGELLKRRALFELASDLSEFASKPMRRMSSDNSSSKAKQGGKVNESNSKANGTENNGRLSSGESSPVKEKPVDKSRNKTAANSTSDSRQRLSNGDLSSAPSLQERLSNIEKQNSAAEKKGQISENSVTESLQERLSNLDSACNKELNRKVTPDRDPSFQAKLADFRNIEEPERVNGIDSSNKHTKSPEADSERSSSPEDEMIFETKKQFHRSLDSLDVEGSSDVGNEAFERVQSLEDLDCCSNRRNYPASASSTEMLVFSSQSGDTDREDSGIHTADVSCSVSQADEPVEDGEIIATINSVVPHLETSSSGADVYHLEMEIINQKHLPSSEAAPSNLTPEPTETTTAYLDVKGSINSSIGSPSSSLDMYQATNSKNNAVSSSSLLTVVVEESEDSSSAHNPCLLNPENSSLVMETNTHTVNNTSITSTQLENGHTEKSSSSQKHEHVAIGLENSEDSSLVSDINSSPINKTSVESVELEHSTQNFEHVDNNLINPDNPPLMLEINTEPVNSTFIASTAVNPESSSSLVSESEVVISQTEPVSEISNELTGLEDTQGLDDKITTTLILSPQSSFDSESQADVYKGESSGNINCMVMNIENSNTPPPLISPETSVLSPMFLNTTENACVQPQELDAASPMISLPDEMKADVDVCLDTDATGESVNECTGSQNLIPSSCSHDMNVEPFKERDQMEQQTALLSNGVGSEESKSCSEKCESSNVQQQKLNDTKVRSAKTENITVEETTTSKDCTDNQQTPKVEKPVNHVPIEEKIVSKSKNQIEDEVFLPTSQIPPLELSSDVEIVAGLAFPLGPPTSAEPPKEKPPPPPSELSDEEAPPKTSLKRLDSTKRIKKEIWRKRSDFLGIDGGNDDSYLEPELKVAPPPDMTTFLVEERRSEQQLYRQSICSESDSNHGETTESRDSGVELDRAHSDDWNGKLSSTPDVLSAQHSRQNSDIYGTASITSEEDEIMKKEREIIEILEKEEQWRYRNNATKEENDIGEKLAVKLHQLEQEKMRLEWERTEEENMRQMKENARREEELRLRAKEQELRQQESLIANPMKRPTVSGKEERLVTASGEALQAERERLQRENEELRRQKETLQLRECQQLQHMQHQQQQWGSTTALPHQQWNNEAVLPTHLSLQDISMAAPSSTINLYHSTVPMQSTAPLNYRLSLPDLQQEEQMQNQPLPTRQATMMPSPRATPNRRPPPPIPPAKPLRVVSQEQRERENSIRNSRMPSADCIPQHVESTQGHHGSVPAHIGAQPITSQPISRQTLQALSAVPRSRFISNDMWLQAKKKPENQRNNGRESSYNYQHWLIQEAEHRRITEQQQRNAISPRKTSPSQPHTAHQPSWGSSQTQQRQDKPLPDSIIQTLTQRVQNRVGMQDNKTVSPIRRRHEENVCRESQQVHTAGHMPTTTPASSNNPSLSSGDSQEKMLSVSGKKKCSHCGEELGRGAAMIIESLRLFYHIDCFKCCVCHVQLGDGLMGTDVRVRNNKLHCHNCYSSDDGVKFSCV